jgi:hypothetical protein
VVPLICLQKKFEVRGSTGLSLNEIWGAWFHWFVSKRNLRCVVPLVCLLTKFYVPSSSAFSPFQISHALLQYLFISVRNFACLAPVVLLVSAIKLWAEDNFLIYLMLFLYTLPKQTSCTLLHIPSEPWCKFLLHILFWSHFTTSYMLWETSKHGVDDIHQWHSFHTRIRENRSTASKVVLLQKLQRGHTSGIEVSKTNILFTCLGRKVC